MRYQSAFQSAVFIRRTFLVFVTVIAVALIFDLLIGWFRVGNGALVSAAVTENVAVIVLEIRATRHRLHLQRFSRISGLIDCHILPYAERNVKLKSDKNPLLRF